MYGVCESCCLVTIKVIVEFATKLGYDIILNTRDTLQELNDDLFSPYIIAPVNSVHTKTFFLSTISNTMFVWIWV